MRAVTFLPKGATLSVPEFEARHRAILWLVFVQDAGLFIFGLARHVGLWIDVLECALIAILGGVSAARVLSPRFRAAVATMALIITSSIVVQFSGGYIEAHFHFFVMLAVIFLYQDWIPDLLAIGYVAIDHGVIGAIFPGAVYNHPSAVAHPFLWALIHAAFVLAESAALIAGWKVIESTEDLRRSEMVRFNRELASQAKSLAQSEDRARQANAAKSEFLASMSHELRTPMTSILGFAELLADGIDGELNGEQLEDVERIRQSGGNLLMLLDEVLDLSKIEAGRISLTYEEVDLGALVASVLTSLRPLADNRSLYLKTRHVDDVTVTADPQRIRQVITNLVGNALKFTKEGGHCRPAKAWCVSRSPTRALGSRVKIGASSLRNSARRVRTASVNMAAQAWVWRSAANSCGCTDVTSAWNQRWAREARSGSRCPARRQSRRERWPMRRPSSRCTTTESCRGQGWPHP
jgi:signal transduction histidine kinase